MDFRPFDNINIPSIFGKVKHFLPREHFFTTNLITKYYKMLQSSSSFLRPGLPHPPPFARAF
nr:MAG TPA: hypothetical protein [Caudoviricetes sp.]